MCAGFAITSLAITHKLVVAGCDEGAQIVIWSRLTWNALRHVMLPRQPIYTRLSSHHMTWDDLKQTVPYDQSPVHTIAMDKEMLAVGISDAVFLWDTSDWFDKGRAATSEDDYAMRPCLTEDNCEDGECNEGENKERKNIKKVEKEEDEEESEDEEGEAKTKMTRDSNSSASLQFDNKASKGLLFTLRHSDVRAVRVLSIINRLVIVGPTRVIELRCYYYYYLFLIFFFFLVLRTNIVCVCVWWWIRVYVWELGGMTKQCHVYCAISGHLLQAFEIRINGFVPLSVSIPSFDAWQLAINSRRLSAAVCQKAVANWDTPLLDTFILRTPDRENTSRALENIRLWQIYSPKFGYLASTIDILVSLASQKKIQFSVCNSSKLHAHTHTTFP